MQSDHIPEKIVTYSIYIITAFISLFSVYTFYYNQYAISAFVPDDYFYYTTIADTILQQGMSSFDGITLTNGYHPLYLAIIVVLAFVSGSTKSILFYVLLQVLIISSSIQIYRSCNKLYSLCSLSGIKKDIILFISWFISYKLILLHMEIVMTIPLLYMFFYNIVKPQLQASYTILSSICLFVVLSRIDTVILLALPLFFYFSALERKNKYLFFIHFLPACIVIASYLYINTLSFQSIIPISGLAKGLTIYPFILSFHFWQDFFYHPFELSLYVISIVLFIISLSKKRDLIVQSMLFSIILYFIVVSARSDWALFDWYFYPLILVVPSIILLFSNDVQTLYLKQSILYLFMIIIGLWSIKYMYRVHNALSSESSNYTHAHSIHTWLLHNNIKIAAMGDRSGLTGYIHQGTIINLEGLVSNRKLIDSIDAQAELQATLKEFRSEALIVSVYEKLLTDKNGKYIVYQPHPKQAGLYSKKMTGYLGNPDTIIYNNNDQCRTYIWDLR